jgi:ankyrin repeat protein
VHLKVKEGASPDAADTNGCTALHLAALHDEAGLIPLLVTANNLNAFGRGNFEATPLILAAEAGKTAAVRALLKAKADIRCCSGSGYTALAAALVRRHFDTAVLLFQHARLQPDREAILAAAVSKAGPALNWEKQGYTPLAQAVKEGRDELLPLLATPRSINRPLPKILGGETPLTLALKHGRMETAEVLLAAGAAAGLPDANGLIPLAYALCCEETHLNARLLKAVIVQPGVAAAAAGANAAAGTKSGAQAGQASTRDLFTKAAVWVIKNSTFQRIPVERLLVTVMATCGEHAPATLAPAFKECAGYQRLVHCLLWDCRKALLAQYCGRYVPARLQRLVLDPPGAGAKQKPPPLPYQGGLLGLREPLHVLLARPAQAVRQKQPGRGPARGRPAAVTFVRHLAHRLSSREVMAVAAASRGGSHFMAASKLRGMPPEQQPAALLVVAYVAGAAGHVRLCNAALTQFVALKWGCGCERMNTSYAEAIWKTAGAELPAILAGAARSTTGATHSKGPATSAPEGQGQPQQQKQQGTRPDTGFCLCTAALANWQSIRETQQREVKEAVVRAVQRATAL